MSCKDQKKVLAADVNWHDITEGGIIPWAGNADQYETGSWRSEVPVWTQEKCKQCMMCYYVCPDSSILVNEEPKMTGIDMDHCKGCGVCVKICPFKALELTEEKK